jgi:tetratricopeptide (TPR) repeat protein
LLYDWGYASYSNPYVYSTPATVVVDPMVYDYTQPISSLATPVEPTVADKTTTLFDSARDAFKAGDYTRALDLTDQAIRELPNDSVLHEFRGVTLFALHRYAEAAVPLYAVLAVGPGWDWSTFIGLYPDVSVYTEQLRALESYCNQNAGSAPARFVLAYLYLTQGHTSAALEQLKHVSALQSKDTVSANLIKQLEGTGAPAPATSGTANRAATPPAPSGLATPVAPVAPGKFEGTWSSRPDQDTTITLEFPGEGKFNWKVDQKGHNRQLQGIMTAGNGLLTLAPDQGQPMVGNVTWRDESHFTFKVPGVGPDDPGLSFAREH